MVPPRYRSQGERGEELGVRGDGPTWIQVALDLVVVLVVRQPASAREHKVVAVSRHVNNHLVEEPAGTRAFVVVANP